LHPITVQSFGCEYDNRFTMMKASKCQ